MQIEGREKGGITLGALDWGNYTLLRDILCSFQMFYIHFILMWKYIPYQPVISIKMWVVLRGEQFPCCFHWSVFYIIFLSWLQYPYFPLVSCLSNHVSKITPWISIERQWALKMLRQHWTNSSFPSAVNYIFYCLYTVQQCFSKYPFNNTAIIFFPSSKFNMQVMWHLEI